MSPMKLFSYLNNQLDYYMTGKKVTGQLSASQWHEKHSHFHLHPKQALFLDFSIVSMGARDLVSNPFPVYYLWYRLVLQNLDPDSVLAVSPPGLA